MSSTGIASRDIEARAGLFAALSDPIRLRVLDVLGADQQCVCDLHAVIDIAPNLMSYHLRVLREAGLVRASRRGRWVDYRLADDAIRLVADALPGVLRLHDGTMTTGIEMGATA